MHSASNAALPNAALMLALALAFAVLGIAVILGFILMRRIVRRRYFRRRDALSIDLRANRAHVITGVIPAERWMGDRTAREIVQEMLLQQIEATAPDDLFGLHALLRASGLVERLISEAGRGPIWRRRKALLTLGRMRLRGCVAALVGALDDPHEEVVVDAIRALGRIGDPRAGEAILRRLARQKLRCPAQIFETALADCYRVEPAKLLPLIARADDAIRPVLARALGRIATPEITGGVLELAQDPVANVRASAARVIGLARPPGSAEALRSLAYDTEWFVRLRAMVALGELCDSSTIPVLISGLCDANRLVRLRAASALARMDGQEEEILQLAMRAQDRYALQALVSAMEQAGKIMKMAETLAMDEHCSAAESALRAASAGGAGRMLMHLATKHPNLLVRERLAQLLAPAGVLVARTGVETPEPADSALEYEGLRRLVAAVDGWNRAPAEVPAR